MNEKALKQEILRLKAQVSTLQESLDTLKDTLQTLEDIAWERDSKKESSKMYKVLENEKPSTIVKSNVGNVIVDREFMEKEIQKHLDDPTLRGMVTSQEMLSFPKVARNIEAEFNKEINDYTWRVKANDESILAYGSREYVKDNKETNRLLTAHSKTERGQRQADRVSSATYFNDPDFRGSAHSDIIPQKQQSDTETKQNTQDSALERMKQKIEAYAQKGFDKKNPKNKDKGVQR